MLTLTKLITSSHIVCRSDIASKKRVLEQFSTMLENAEHKPDSDLIFNGLLQREKIGSTAIGQGVAIPHARIESLQKPTVGVITLAKPIEYDAPDHKPVDIFFALLVPSDAPEKHLELLRQIAKFLSEPDTITKIRHSKTKKALYNTLLMGTVMHEEND